MGFTTIMWAMASLRDDARWQVNLSVEERALCLAWAERRFHEALDLTEAQARQLLVTINMQAPRMTPAFRDEALRAMLE